MATQLNAAPIDSPDVRRAGPDLLSLALMDARNHTLNLLAQLEAAVAAAGPAAEPPQGPPQDTPLWLAGHIGWFAEAWIGRNTQRARGAQCPASPTRLASIEPQADHWWRPAALWGAGAQQPVPSGPAAAAPDAGATRAWLLETLEGTLDLLDKAASDDDSLYFYRLALFHEDLRGEQIVAFAQAAGLAIKLDLPPLTVPREALAVPPTRWQLGTPEGGFRFDNEAGPHEAPVPEFEIDAQAVNWAQFVEFVDDSGYDRAELWSPEGWRWLEQQAQLEGRRGPRYVEEIGTASGAVMQTRFGRRMRVAGSQAAVHVSWWEAQAWANWAGRRLATEVEWEIAAHTGAGRGFRWGEVLEWTAGTLRPWPGFVPGPWADYSAPWFGEARVLRGASFATRARLRNPKLRRFALPGVDGMFCGFRTCAL